MKYDPLTGEDMRKPTMIVQDWRTTKNLLSKTKTYENAVELQRVTRILKNTVRSSLVVYENHK